MAHTGQLIDCEGPVRDWARTATPVAAVVAGRVYLEIPSAPVYPLVRVTVLPGTVDAGEAPVWSFTAQFDCWAATRAAAAELAWTIANLAFHLPTRTPLGSTLTALATTVARAPQHLPDPDAARVPDTIRPYARYSTDISFLVRSADG